MSLAPHLRSVVKEIAEEMARAPTGARWRPISPNSPSVDPDASARRRRRRRQRRAGGDADTPFSIQSISKVFTLTLALGMVGDRLWRRVGREPSGIAVQLDRPARTRARHPAQPLHQCRRDRRHRRHPVRPSAARGARRDPALRAIPGRRASIAIDEAVAASEKRTGFRNAALANYMKSFGVLENPVDYTLGVYFHHCAIAMSCRQLAMAGRYLAHGGSHPTTGHVVSPNGPGASTP